jgi:hypothetical protein
MRKGWRDVEGGVGRKRKFDRRIGVDERVSRGKNNECRIITVATPCR